MASAAAGRSTVSIDGVEHELDVVVATGDTAPAERRIVGIGEAKAGATITERHLHHLEQARAAYGPRAASATLLLFGTDIDPGLTASDRHDVELVDLPRLYAGT